LGARRPESWVVPTSSFVMMAILVVVGGFGAALGTWLSAGYAIGDFAWRVHPAPAGHDTYGLYALVHVRAPLVIAYVVLAGLAVAVPLGSRRLASSAALGVHPNAPNENAIRRTAHATLSALLTGAWLIVAPTLLHPLFTWQGVGPPSTIVPSRGTAWLMAVLAAGAALARDSVESLASGRPGYARWETSMQGDRPTPVRLLKRALPVELTLFAGAAFGTFLLSGLLSSSIDALLLCSVLLLVGVFRRGVSQATGWGARISRIPVTVRFAASAVAGIVLSLVIIRALRQQSPVFLREACAIGASLAVTTLFLARGASRKVAPGTSGGAVAAFPSARPVVPSSSPEVLATARMASNA